MAQRTTRPPLDPLLLLEAALVLLLAGLALAWFLVPVADGSFLPGWWVAVVLGALFLAVLLVDRWRRKRRNRLGLREALLRGLEEEGAPPPP